MDIKKIIMLCFLFKQEQAFGMFDCCTSSKPKMATEILSVKTEFFAYDKEGRVIQECETKEYSDKFVKKYSGISYKDGSERRVLYDTKTIEKKIALKK